MEATFRIVIISWFSLVLLPSAWALKEASWRLGIWSAEVQQWSERRDRKQPPNIEMMRDGEGLLRIGTRWLWFGSASAGGCLLLNELFRFYKHSKRGERAREH